jgi:hypothetical protein
MPKRILVRFRAVSVSRSNRLGDIFLSSIFLDERAGSEMGKKVVYIAREPSQAHLAQRRQNSPLAFHFFGSTPFTRHQNASAKIAIAIGRSQIPEL